MKDGELENVVSLDEHRRRESVNPLDRMSEEELLDYQHHVLERHRELTDELTMSRLTLQAIRFKLAKMELDHE